MPLPTITSVGRLVADPELRFTPQGKAVCKVRIAFSDRKKDPATGEWSDGEKCFLDASFWEQEAENVAESLTQGTEVVVTGRLRQREYTDREGVKRTVYELMFASIGPTMKWSTVKVAKMDRSGGQGGQSSGRAQTGGVPGDGDPWATAQAGASAGSKSSTFDDEAPF